MEEYKRNKLFKRDRDTDLIEKYTSNYIESTIGETLGMVFCVRCNRQNTTKKHKRP